MTKMQKAPFKILPRFLKPYMSARKLHICIICMCTIPFKSSFLFILLAEYHVMLHYPYDTLKTRHKEESEDGFRAR